MQTIHNKVSIDQRGRESGKNRMGTTLVEVVVFLSLALFVLAGTFPLLSYLMVADKATEETLAAFTFLQASGEKWKVRPYNSLTNGLTQYTTTNGTTYYRSDLITTSFGKTVAGQYYEDLYPQATTGIGEYYRLAVVLQWSTEIGGVPKKDHNKIVYYLLMPDT